MLVGNGGRQSGGVLVLMRRDRREDEVEAVEVATLVLTQLRATNIDYYNVSRLFGLRQLRVLGGVVPDDYVNPIPWTVEQAIETGRKIALTSPVSLTFRKW